MKFKIFSLLCMLSFHLSCSYLPTREENIKYSSHYSPLDNQYWDLMVKKSENEKISIIKTIKMVDPALHNQIIKDAEDPLLLTFWGQSLNYDSGAKKQITSDQIIMDLHAVFNLHTNNKIVHAGVTHTYGYLFSVLDTPYGYKRKRWIVPELNNAFSFEGQSLSPEARNGGLLSNVTYFMGMLAFKNESDRLSLKKLKNVSYEVKNFMNDSLTIFHLEEILRDFTLRTTLIKLPIKNPAPQNDYLLIYSVLDHKLNKELLITAFPLSNNAFQKIIATEDLGPNRPVSIRYNAYLEGAMSQNLSGNRILWSR